MLSGQSQQNKLMLCGPRNDSYSTDSSYHSVKQYHDLHHHIIHMLHFVKYHHPLLSAEVYTIVLHVDKNLVPKLVPKDGSYDSKTGPEYTD